MTTKRDIWVEDDTRCHVAPTPGPWTHDDEFCIGARDGGNTIAMTGQDPQLPQVEHEANARAIAALPDLLDRLDGLLEQAANMYKALSRNGRTEGWEDALDEIDNAAAAIKSITGD